MLKKLTKFLSLIMAVFMVFTASACFGNSGSSDPNKLDIYLLYKGYGDAWLTPLIDEFVKQDWVKDKYPGIKRSDISYSNNDDDAHQYNKLGAGASINSYDLMFGVNLQGRESTGQLADLTDLVYLAEVPGEAGVKVKDKIPERVLARVRNATAKERADGEDTYNVVSYIDGMFGMMYNHTLLVDNLGLEIPLTTEQFKSVGNSIKNTGYKNTLNETSKEVIMNRAGDNYWNSSYSIWWAQYEGIQAVEDYYEGYDRGNEISGSRSVLFQEGRLESLTVVQDILNNYSYSSALTVLDYKRAQTLYLQGRGIFHFNGDYFASEMAAQMANCTYDIRFMKMPVISSIAERCSFYTDGETEYNSLSADKKLAYDQKLQIIIKDVDSDLPYSQSNAKTQGISKTDFDIVAEARCIGGYAGASGQAVVIPSYSPAKKLAADFLRFMYTEEAIRTFTKASKGIVLPSTYDISADQEVMSVVDPISKSKIDLLKGTENYQFIRIPAPAQTTLGKAGLGPIFYEGYFENVFHPEYGVKKTAKEIYDGDLDHWNQTTWEQLVRDSN